MIIAVDVDGVLADVQKEVLRQYNSDYGDSLSVDDIRSWDMALYVKPECGTKVYEYFRHRHMYASDAVGMVELAIWGVDQLEEAGHRVIYVTTPARGTNGVKMEWLRRHGLLWDDADYVECHDKSLIRADVLVDDGAHNLAKFVGKRILFNQPWNAKENVSGAWRAFGWKRVVEIVKSIQEDWNRFGIGQGGTP